MNACRGRFVALAAATLLALACVGGDGAPPAPRRDVLLVILDTARADHLSSYGYPQLTTPAFDALASEGVRYDSAWSQSSWTLPAIATVLTGQPPHVHGAGRTAQGMFGVRETVPTLAERLAAASWNTAAFINVVWCDPRLSSLDRGFGIYDFSTSDESNIGQRDARATTDAALAWLAGAGERPFFLTVHYFDAHLTYDPPAPYDTMFEPDDGGPTVGRGFGSAEQVFAIREGRLRLDRRRRESLVARYDGELRFIDEQFARLRAGLEAAGRWERTLVVVVGDHGEEFWDHGGFEHGHSHHRELIRVPLIVRRPGGAAGAVDTGRVRQLDIAPTVLDWAGLGRDELPGTILGADTSAPFAVAEGSLWAGDLVSVRDDDGVVIVDRTRGSTVYYGADDPLELRPLPAAAAPRRSVELVRAIPQGRGPEDRPRELTDEQRERLRSLGYLR